MIRHFPSPSLSSQQVQVHKDRASKPSTADPLAEQQFPWRLNFNDGEIRAFVDATRIKVGDRVVGLRSHQDAAANLPHA